MKAATMARGLGGKKSHFNERSWRRSTLRVGSACSRATAVFRGGEARCVGGVAAAVAVAACFVVMQGQG